MASKITDTDKGYRELNFRVKGAPPTYVKVGVDDTLREDGRMTNGQVAAIHEFGSGHVPQRSFIRSWADEHEHGIRTKMGQVAASSILHGELTWEEAMQAFGRYCVRGVRKQIKKNIPPPLDAGTVKRKGHDLALVDTKQMYAAVTYEIENVSGGQDVSLQAQPVVEGENEDDS